MVHCSRRTLLERLDRLVHNNPHKSSWPSRFKKQDDEVYNWIFEESSFLDELDRKVSFSERVYVTRRRIKEIQMCKCGTPLNFLNGGYLKKCGRKCPEHNSLSNNHRTNNKD